MMEVVVDREIAAPEAPAHVEEQPESLDDAHSHVSRSLGALLAPPSEPGGSRSRPSGGGPPPLLTPTLRHVQRLAGNQATAAVADQLRERFLVQRVPDGEDGEAAPVANVSVTGLTVSPDTVTLPRASAVQATAAPADATGVTFSIAAGTANTDNVAIDATTGAITISAGQQGGTIAVSADAADGSGVTSDLVMIERPGAISATSASGSANYGGEFTHTFTAPSGHAAGLEGANINEEFSSLTATAPWGAFTLTANAAGSHGWDLDSSGTMAGPDNVTIDAASVDIGKLVHSTSNPARTATMPQGFTMTQRLFATVLPGGALEGTPFLTVAHRRELIDGHQFKVTAGLGSIIEDYSGPEAVTNARASSSTVMASPPRPETGEWAQRKVTIAADAIPDSATLTYSITGADLGCSVDSDGEVSIGSTAGTITVRVTAAATNFDDVTITITEHVAAESTEPETAPPADSSGPGAAVPPTRPAPPAPASPTAPGSVPGAAP